MRRQEGVGILVDRVNQYNHGLNNCENVTSRGCNVGCGSQKKAVEQ
jgi:hypothetical protein